MMATKAKAKRPAKSALAKTAVKGKGKPPAPKPSRDESVKFSIHLLRQGVNVYEFGDHGGYAHTVTVPKGVWMACRTYTVPKADRVFHTVFMVWGDRPNLRVFSHTRAVTLAGVQVPCDPGCCHAAVVRRAMGTAE